MPSLAQLSSRVKRVAAAVYKRELLFLGVAAPFLLFPNRWTPAAFALILFTWLCRWLACGRLTWRTAMDLPIALLLLMALLASLISVDPAMSRAKLWGLVLEAALFFGVVNAVRDVKSLWAVVTVLVGLTAGVALFSLVGTDWDAVRLVDLPWLYGRLPRLVQGLPGSGVPRASTLFHPREVGATLAMLLPIPIALLLFGSDRRLRLLSALALAAAVPVLLLTQSLQALLGLGLALLLIAVWRSRWALLVIPLGLLAIAAALWAYGPARAAFALLSLDHPIGAGVVLRLDIWSRALAMVRDMPYTGIGLNTFPLIQAQFYPGVLLGPEVHAHNLVLHTAVDLGLPGLLAFLWLIVAFFVVVTRAYRATQNRDLRVLLAGLAAGVVAYLGNGLLDAVTLGAKPVAALFIMFGLAAAVLKVGGQRAGAPVDETEALPAGLPASRSRSPLAPLAALALLVALLALGLLISPSGAALNLGAVRAHQVLVQARQTGSLPAADPRAVLAPLERVVRPEPPLAAPYRLLGSLYAWQGEPDAAIGALDRAVTLDGEGSIARYAPWLPWQRGLQGADPPGRWQDLIFIYTQWMQRYPDRSETYVQLALIYDRHLGDPDRARAVLRSGLEQGAAPAGLLARYLARLE